MLVRQRKPLLHVVANHRGGYLRLEFVVRIDAWHLILHEELRFLELADVMVVAPHPRQQPVGTQSIAGCLAQIGQRYAMCIGTRSLRRQPAQQRTVGIRQLKQGEFRGNPGHRLEEREREVHQARGTECVQPAEQRRFAYLGNHWLRAPKPDGQPSQ